MRFPTCHSCGERPAAITLRDLGAEYCAACLERSVLRRARSSVADLLSEGDRVVVALSGGKDSSVALYVLSRMAREGGMDVDLAALTVDEGTPYRRGAIRAASELAAMLGVPHRVVSLKDYHGISIGELEGSLPPGHRRSPCTYCGVLRRQTLNVAAREMGADWLATGHNLDDLVQTYVMNLIRGDVNAMGKLISGVRSPSEALIPRIRPLELVYERETAALSVALGLPAQLGKCPMTRGLRIPVRRALDDVELSNPGFKRSLYEGLTELLRRRRTDILSHIEVRPCEICGEPTTGTVCKACELKGELESILGRRLPRLHSA